MNEIANYKKIIAAVGAFLFISPNLNIPESILTYCGISSHDTVRLLAVIIFAVIDVILVLAFFKAKPSPKMYLILVVFNAIYILPQVINKDLTAMMQYCLFVVPTTVFAIMLSADDEIKEKFFVYLRAVTKILMVIALVYIILQYVGTNRDKYGMIIIENMTYGDMAYLFLPGFVVCLIDIVESKSIFSYLGIVIFSLAILFAGARSTVLCIACAIVIYWIILIVSKAEKKRFIRVLIVTVLTVATLFTGMLILPTGSRLDVLNINIKSEQFSENIIFETKATSSRTLTVIYVPTGEEKKLYDLYRDEIINNDRSKKETERILREDVKNNTEEYIKLINEDDRAKAESYFLTMNRDFLWKAAIAEFKKHPLTGNGFRYYKNKYDGYFPHNIFLEAMADFGAIGLIIITALGAFCFIKGMLYYFKNKNVNILRMLLLLFSQFPGYVLYTTMYNNASLALTIVFFTTLGVLDYNERKDPKLDK